VDITKIIEVLIWSAFVGGGLWKGLDAIANALSKRAEAMNKRSETQTAAERLDFEQMQANYTNAMGLIDRQSKRIDSLTQKVERYEARIDSLSNKIENQEREQEGKELAYNEQIKSLQIELENVRREYKALQEQYTALEEDYQKALARIVALEKTGPLSEK
jgi:predicted RNase H-like nuclease (RuvC/YqgF family)